MFDLLLTSQLNISTSAHRNIMRDTCFWASPLEFKLKTNKQPLINVFPLFIFLCGPSGLVCFLVRGKGHRICLV